MAIEHTWAPSLEQFDRTVTQIRGTDDSVTDSVNASRGVPTVSCRRMTEADARGDTDLHRAVYADDDGKVAELCRSARAGLDQPNLNGDTPLICAVQMHSSRCVAVLLQAHASVASRNCAGYSPLLIAASEGRTELVALLARSVVQTDVALLDETVGGYTPLHWASINGASGAVHVLLTAGASCDVLSHPDGQTALIKAAQYNAPECIERLCRHGADVDVQDTNGRTALHYAARAGSTRSLEALLAAGALVHLTDDRGLTPIRTAAAAKSVRSVHLLALAGATMPNLGVAHLNQPPATCGLGSVMNSVFCRVMCVPCDVADAISTTHAAPSSNAPKTN